MGGDFPGEVAVVALGKCGSREMSAGSDLDLMTLYRAADPVAMSATKGWDASTFYGRFTQRLIAALSSPTAEGQLYEVDMQLRPSGTKGPVAVSFAAFEHCYQGEAETWELLALTRARVVWATTPDFAAAGQAAIEAALQFLQLAHAAEGGPLRTNTAEALTALGETGLASPGQLSALCDAWRLQQDLTQLLKVALGDGPAPGEEPKAFQSLLARAGGVKTLKALEARLAGVQAAARTAYAEVVKS